MAKGVGNFLPGSQDDNYEYVYLSQWFFNLLASHAGSTCLVC
jgi:hypothetical protein